MKEYLPLSTLLLQYNDIDIQGKNHIKFLFYANLTTSGKIHETEWLYDPLFEVKCYQNSSNLL